MMWKSRENYPWSPSIIDFHVCATVKHRKWRNTRHKSAIKKTINIILDPCFHPSASAPAAICHFIVFDGIYERQQTVHNFLHRKFHSRHYRSEV